MSSFARIPLAAALLAATLALSACSKGSGPAPNESQAAQPEVEISTARVVLPAVGGNPGAAYFDLSNHTAAPLVLTGVSVAGAERSEMHETMGTAMNALPTVTIAPGRQVSFAPGGRHVMIFGLPATATAGSSIQMTFQFEGGRQEEATAVIEPAGGGAMGGMEHDGAMH